MVKGLSVFQDWFKDFEDQYVLIGGTAAKITMAQEGLNFRINWGQIPIVLSWRAERGNTWIASFLAMT